MFDRDCDLVSPLCVSQNYEGLLDEFFGIRTGAISVSNKIVYPDEKVRKELGHKEDGFAELNLQAENAVYQEIRYKHFNLAGPHLNKQLVDI